MNRNNFLVLILVFISSISVPLFADISIDLGVSALGNAYLEETRPLGGITSLGVTIFDDKAIVQVSGGILSPALSDDSENLAVIISTGLLFSPLEYLYVGFRTGMITEDVETWLNYGSMVLKVQNPGKGIHYFAESEISFSGIFNCFSMGVNFTL